MFEISKPLTLLHEEPQFQRKMVLPSTRRVDMQNDQCTRKISGDECQLKIPQN